MSNVRPLLLALAASQRTEEYTLRFNNRMLSQIAQITVLLCLSGCLAGCESVLRVIFNDGRGLRSQNEQPSGSSVAALRLSEGEKLPEVPEPAQQASR
jgi:hypothetical protein